MRQTKPENPVAVWRWEIHLGTMTKPYHKDNRDLTVWGYAFWALLGFIAGATCASLWQGLSR
jgi:hypothetical protein